MSKVKPNIIQDNLRECALRIPTPDEWYGTYEDGTVKVSVINLTSWNNEKPCIRVCVWGNDDFGLEKDTYFENNEEVQTFFDSKVKEVNGWSIVTIKMLREMGFVGA